MTTTTLPTRNAEWGFFGTIGRLDNEFAADAGRAWTPASAAVATVTALGAPLRTVDGSRS